MTNHSMRFGRLSAAALALSILAGAVRVSAAQAAPPADDPTSYAHVTQGRDAHLTAERFQDAGLHDCSRTDLHAHLRRMACGGN